MTPTRSAARAARGGGILAAASLALAGLLLLGYGLTLVSAFTLRGGHPPLSAVLWVGMIFASLGLAPLGLVLAAAAIWLARRGGRAPGVVALLAALVHAVLLGYALYSRFSGA